MNSSENWLNIRAVLDEALELPAEQRPAFVASHCQDSTLRRQVFSILAAYEEDGSLQLEITALELLPQEPGAAPGERIGPYQLLEKKGEGGMGAVYLATRADSTFDKKVAIKLLKRGWGGAGELRRFRVERQILANLEHPNIAKLLDGGSTAAGQPYFVMELVEGLPLDEYCEKHSLDLDQRLALFLEVCSAVEFAHQNLIVHRDLKPGNILVGEDGRPRLLDFGIAKILSPDLFAEPIEETVAGVTPMTPQYASPEQIRGNAVGTASDVYSLGVILYRLLTGLPPYRFDSRDMKAVVDAVCHQEVLPPSVRLKQGGGRSELARAAQVAGDLDAIVLQALAKDPARRYPTAAQLADDLRRHLAKEPVRARGDAFSYRAARFVQRNRLALGAAALVFLILIASVWVLLRQQRNLIAERNRAISERNRSETVSSWLVDLFTLSDPGRSLGAQVTARELLDRSKASIRSELAAEPELLSTLLGTLGETYENLGLLPEANELFADAVVQLRKNGASDSRLAEALRLLAENQRSRFQLLPARRTATTALLLAEKASGSKTALAVRCRIQVAKIESLLGNADPARALFDQALEDARALGDQAAIAEALEYRAMLFESRGEFPEAYAGFEEALEIQRRLRDAGHPLIARVESKAAMVLIRTDPVAAERQLRAKAQEQKKLYGEAHPYLLSTVNNLGFALFRQGRLDESEALFNEALAIADKVHGGRSGGIAQVLLNLGNVAAARNDFAGVDRFYREARDVQGRESGEQTATYALYTLYLAQFERARGNLDEALRLTNEALATTEATIGTENPQTVQLLANKAEIRRQQGHVEEALELFRRAVRIGRASKGWWPQLQEALNALAVAEYDAGLLEDARPHFMEVEAGDVGSDPGYALWSATYLAVIDNKLGRPVEAENWARKAIAGYIKSGDTSWVNTTRRELGYALAAQGRYQEAETELKRYLEDLPPSAAPTKATVVRAKLAELAKLRQEKEGGTTQP